jgi:formylglycine-generating enzyme required for sulfatase activity
MGDMCPACLLKMGIEAIADADPSKRFSMLAPEEIAPLFPHYEILRILGRGGMGAVYLASQKSLNRLVAIKVLPYDLDGSDGGFAVRFKNEAQAMAQLSHPGIVAVFDFGETTNGLLYIVMEYVEGTDVQLMLASHGRLHSARAMAITAHVCDALYYAHQRGIIHRDIKPSNIMVSNDGVVKVADFGLAKMSRGGQTSGLTQSGAPMGTPHFMAPEALTLGGAVDRRADIYAVGVMLYQMLTGKLPQGLFELPSLQVPGLDPRYDNIVAKALREDRDVRYQDAAELRHDLDAILTQPVVKAEVEQVSATPKVQARPQRHAAQTYRPRQRDVSRPVRTRKTSLGEALIWAAVVVVLAVGGILWVTNGLPRPAQLQARVDTPAPVKLTPPPASGTKAGTASAAAKGDFTNTLGMKFVTVPGTEVLMCIHETRRQDYAAYAWQNSGVDDAWKHQTLKGSPVGYMDDHPVVSVNWDDAQKFCMWLSRKESKTYRLPTDREWSQAVGIGRDESWTKGTTPEMLDCKLTTAFPWGGAFPPKTEDRAGNYGDTTTKEKLSAMSWIEGYTDGYPTTAPVMSFKPNPYGFHDLGGNVSEWVEDRWNAVTADRVLRGGSWSHHARQAMLSSIRFHNTPGNRIFLDGFRIVLAAATTAATTPVVKPPAAPQGAPAMNGSEVVNSLGMKFVKVPDTAVMFCIHETRYKDYAAFAAQTPGLSSRWKDQTGYNFTIVDRPADHPVTTVSWDDAQKFCAWLSRAEGRKYRLPTDQEWSVAVGLGPDEKWKADTTPASVFKPTNSFPWGDTWPPPPDAGNYSDASRKARAPWVQSQYFDSYDDGFPTTAPVMSFKSNKGGIYDMGGNVCEWVEDWYDARKQHHTLRGGSFAFGNRGVLLSSYRVFAGDDYLNTNQGFRIVLEVSKPVGTPAATTKMPAGIAR